MSNHLVIDDFLPKEDHLELKQIVMGNGSPWYYADAVDVGDPEEINDLRKFMFTYRFNTRGMWNGRGGELLAPFVEILDPLCWLHIKANLQVRSNEWHLNLFHTDLDGFHNVDHVTGVYYMNTCDGKTVFEDTGEQIDSIANRMLLFPGDRSHTGTTVTNAKTRCVINFNFIQHRRKRWIERVKPS